MLLKGIIFDMDGTITVPYINWRVLRETIGAPPETTIIEHIENLPPDRSARANQVLLDAEREAGQNAEICPGARELIAGLRNRGLKLALVTNNHREAMQTILDRYQLRFNVALSRDDGTLKPSGDLIQKALAALDLTPDDVISIGDGRYDIEACRRVGIRCIYLTHGAPTLNHTPAVETLAEILPLLDTL